MTTYNIGNLVKVDERAAFRNDVQLDNFDNPQLNLGLVNSYLFSSALPGGGKFTQSQSIAPTGVLENLVKAFINSQLDNRFYLIATYGHGKSHLALALANYFSRPYDSPEVKILLEKLGNTLGSRAQASRYDDFKRSRGEFLVLRLRGDVPYSLHEQVLQALEKALGEHKATCDQKLPFWFAEAERIIGGFSPADKEKANRFLESAGHDVPLLLQRLGKREDVYDLCIKVIQHVSGIRPNLGGEVSLAKVVHWAVDEFCGPGKPLGGLLILFDEFSLYVQRYAQRNAAGELQDLLNGVSDRQGRAAFLAFSQLELMQLADNLHIAGETRVGLKRELTRIPQKWVLFSLMESVVDAYLVQDDKRWQAFLSDKKISGPLFQATDVAWDRFKQRYSATLQWSFEQFQEHVVKGCFPLHPITTYLLCNLKLQSDDTGTPRTVLGFVLEELRARQDEPAAEGNRPNWVLPLGLVDYFGGRLSGDVYAQYMAAQRTVGNDAPEEQQAVLKALLLQFLAEITARRDDQIMFLAHAAGLEERAAKQALRTLSDSKVIRYDHSYKVYTFWPASNQPKILEETIQKKLEQFSWSKDTLDELNKTLSTLPGIYFGSIDIKVDWGHAADWAAREYLVTADLLTADWLRSIATQFDYNHRSLIEADRGVVIWVVANRDDEAASIREKVSDLLQTAFAEVSQSPPVVIAVVPTRAQPELLDAYRQRWALLKFSQKERDDAGKEMYDAEVKQADVALFRALKAIRTDDKLPADIQRSHSVYMVPPAYIGEVRRSEQVSLRDLLMRLYRAAFAYAPAEFFTQYRVATKGANKLRDTTRTVSKVLISNATGDLKALARNNSFVRDLCDKFLAQKWELLTADYRIRERPGSRRVREAWQQLDQTIKPGSAETKLRDALFPLLNAPYGYDYNTALLLFAAWFGYHRLDLEISINGRRTQQQALLKLVEKGPKEFFHSIAISDVISLQRRLLPDIATVRQRIQEAGQKQFQLETANDEIVALRETAGDERYNADIRNGAQQAADNLAQAVELAIQYTREAVQIKSQLARASTAQDLIALQKKIERLPILANVQVQEDSPVQLREQIAQRFVAVIETVCQDNEAPKQLTEVGLNRARLMNEKKAVANVGLPALTQRIEESLNRLKEREETLKQALQREQYEQGIRAKINSVDPHGRLQQLLAGAATLHALVDLPDDLASQRDKRLRQVEESIAAIRHQIALSRSELERANEPTKLQSVRDKLGELAQRCAGTEEEVEITAMLEKVEAVRRDLAAQAQREAELKQLILSVNEQATLQQLVDGVSRLRELTDLSADLTQLRDARVRKLDKAITAIHTQIEQAQRELEAAQTVSQIDKLAPTLYALESRCQESAAAEQVTALLTNLNAVRARLAQAEQDREQKRKIIETADSKGSLKQLAVAHEQLSNLGVLPADLECLRQERLGQINQAILEIHNQIENAQTTLTTVREPRLVKKTRDALLKLQGRCAGMPEESEIAQLIEQANQLQNELEEEERRLNELDAIIKGVSANHQRLHSLLDGRATLQGLPPLPAALSRDCAARLRDVEKAIKEIENQVESAGASLAKITEQRQLEKQRDHLLTLKQRCQDTPLEAIVAQHIERAEILRQFFEKLAGESKLQIDSPVNSHAQVKRLQQLARDFAVYLSAPQRGLLADRQMQIQQAVQKQRETARNWIVEQAQAYQRNMPVTELGEKLANPPSVLAFLSAAEQQPLHALRQQVQQRIDADALTAIESRFRQIRDRHVQEQCLQTLQQIYHDLHG